MRIRLLCACALLAAGCVFIGLERDLEQLSELAVIQGQVTQTQDRYDPLVVVLEGGSSERTVDYFVLPRPGAYFFAVPAGSYRIAVFADRNGDLAYQPGAEPAALYDSGAAIALATAERREELDLALDTERLAPIALTTESLATSSRGVGQLPDAQLGTLASLEDPRFSDENAQLGLWHPARFLSESGYGVYFLEQYDPDKIPVLFVHGAVGSPRNFSFLISRLDRSRIQPWLVYYPTALDLATTARSINRVMFRLHAEYDYDEIALVAHSMGVLVSRAAINQATAYLPGRRLVSLPVFVTISTPWNGHAAASLGAEHAPVSAPSWSSMAPGSSFLRELRDTHLPEETRYYLLFSYRGGRSGLIGENNDETVALSSELALDLQRAATRVVGFDESHMSILSSEAVAAALGEVLAQIDAGIRP